MAERREGYTGGADSRSLGHRMPTLSIRARESIKTGLAMAITIAIALRMDFLEPQWAGFAVAMISMDTAGQSLSKAALRMFGTLVAFSRPAGQVACQYYNFLRLGHEGYRKIHGACHDTAEYLAAELEELGPFEVIYGGQRDAGIPRRTPTAITARVCDELDK